MDNVIFRKCDRFFEVVRWVLPGAKNCYRSKNAKKVSQTISNPMRTRSLFIEGCHMLLTESELRQFKAKNLI